MKSPFRSQYLLSAPNGPQEGQKCLRSSHDLRLPLAGVYLSHFHYSVCSTIINDCCDLPPSATTNFLGLKALIMCRQTKWKRQQHTQKSSLSTLPKPLIQWFTPPLSPFLVLCFVPLLSWVNQGYTQWFHKLCVAWFLTKSPFLAKFLAVQGTSVTLGWYAALMNDYYWHGPFGRILYHNMPNCMVQNMANPTGALIYTPMGIFMMSLSHLLDALGHPLLAYYFIQLHFKAGGTWDSLLTWSTILGTYTLSRIWSLVHTYYNFGVFGLFYFGYDVYYITDLDSWLPAYMAEGLLYVVVIGWKLKSHMRKL